jgi:predicted GIY-YIG superfamily endonuclease
MITFRGEKFKEKTITLFRPVGAAEMKLIKDSGYKRFPPRLSGQPFFYPVTTDEYAAKIAKNWNAKNEGIGYVTEFSVKESFLLNYDVQTVGGKDHQEYWIPAEDLEAFNDNIVGKIWDIITFHKWYVYILRCADDTLYTGITNNLQKRIEQHNKGKGAKYTRSRGPVALVKCFERLTKSDALKLEYKIKQLSKEEKLNYAEEEKV